MTETARTFPRVVVTARCMDCELEFTGMIGVRFIEDGEGTGLEIVIIDDKRNELHAVVRVKRELIPTVDVGGQLPPHTGTA